VKQRGVALITAIVLVAIATVLAVHIGTRASLDLRRTTGLISLDQGWHVALGAEAWAIQVLRDDREDSQTDDLSEPWAQPLPPLPVDGGEVRGALEDMQGRFNVNNLVVHDPTTNALEVDEVSIARFERLLTFAGADPRWARILADWLDADTVPGFPEGAEDGTYLAQNPPYRAANGPVTTATEMLALPGMTLEEYERIRPYVAALPVGTTLNVCTAAAPILAALIAGGTDFGDAKLLSSSVVAYRKFARERGWPEALRPREVQFMDFLYEKGPNTREAIARGIGWNMERGQRYYLNCGHSGRGSYLANLLPAGLVHRLAGRIVKGERGRGSSRFLYAIPITIKRGVPETWPDGPQTTTA
jgi:general secretion pathway protein K